MVELKKIVSREEELKKRKTRNLIIGLVLVFIMTFSSAGYAINVAFSNKGSSSADIIKYKGIDFTRDNNGYWNFQYNSKTFLTKYNPLEINDTEVRTGFSLANYNGQVLSFEWNDSQEGFIELDRNLEVNKIPLRVVQRACLSENCSGDYPLKNCSVDNVISFRFPKNNETQRVYVEDNCVFIIANESNQVKYADAFLFNILEI